ncbi:MAG: di-heme enzyme [Gemmatimonadaceae bacterium]|nr:di-heme enzyme [Gemmatimonadaceae bacterium]
MPEIASHRRRVRAVAGAALLLAASGCGGDELFAPNAVNTSGYRWNLPVGFPTPVVPAVNPMSDAKVELGRHLFYDTRLSANNRFSCASCHRQSAAFTDGRAVAIGSTGELHPRNSMSLANVGYASVLNWANPNMAQLEQQALIPMFGEHPVELGMAGQEDELLRRIRDRIPRVSPPLSRRLSRPMPIAGERRPTSSRPSSSFQRSLISGDSPYDRYKFRNDRAALSESARRGEALFFDERTECFHCHTGITFSASTKYVGKAFAEQEFFNNGLYNVDGRGAYPADNIGLKEFTGRAADMGAHKAPTLRNIAVTAPYMHDGSIATLDEVLDHYVRGGRLIRTGPNAGDGAASPFKNGFVKGFELSPSERADMLAFLNSLTDSTFLTDPRLANPWPGGRNPAP